MWGMADSNFWLRMAIKSEDRKSKSERNPKSEIRKHATSMRGATDACGRRRAGTTPRFNVKREPATNRVPALGFRLRNSEFGILSEFGPRISGLTGPLFHSK